MRSIYKSKEGKKRILKLYDQQLKRLDVPYKDITIPTSFGRTHLIETGALTGEPLLVFHGGNATTVTICWHVIFYLRVFTYMQSIRSGIRAKAR